MSNRSLAPLAPLIVLVALAALVAGSAAPALGASFTVNATHDAVDASPGDGVCADAGGGCTLRAAVMETNALAGADEISLPAGTYVVSIPGTNEDMSATGDLDILGELTIAGSGSDLVVIDGGHLDGVFTIGASSGMTISAVAIQNGAGGFLGGAIQNYGTVKVEEAVLRNNTAGSGLASGNGGAIGNSGGILILENSTISENSSTVSGGGISNSGEATISGSTITGNSSDHGGGIFNSESLAIVDSQIVGNVATESGGGISSFSGAVAIDAVTISDNTAKDGGGIQNGVTGIPIPPDRTGNYSENESAQQVIDATLNISRSSIRSNTATQFGGGIQNEGNLSVIASTISANSASFLAAGLANPGSDALPGPWGVASLTNSTVSSNSGVGIGSGGGLSLLNVTIANNSEEGLGVGPFGGVALKNTIITNNLAADCEGGPGFNSLGHNLDSDGTCGLTRLGDISNVDPLLQPLASTGGPTQTHALRAAECGIDGCTPGSPAIDAGDNAACPPTDQRGVARPFDGDQDGNAVCDIGAHENDHVPAVCGCLPTSSPSPATPTPSVTPAVLPASGGEAGSSPGVMALAVPAVAAIAVVALGGAKWRSRRRDRQRMGSE